MDGYVDIGEASPPPAQAPPPSALPMFIPSLPAESLALHDVDDPLSSPSDATTQPPASRPVVLPDPDPPVAHRLRFLDLDDLVATPVYTPVIDPSRTFYTPVMAHSRTSPALPSYANTPQEPHSLRIMDLDAMDSPPKSLNPIAATSFEPGLFDSFLPG